MSSGSPLLQSPSTTQPSGTILPSGNALLSVGSGSGAGSYASPYLTQKLSYPGGDLPAPGTDYFKPYPGVEDIRSPAKVSITSETNEYPVLHYLQSRPWARTNPLPIAPGDRFAYLPHELQHRAGDILFTVSTLESDTRYQHKTCTLTLPKLNEYLAQGYINGMEGLKKKGSQAYTKHSRSEGGPLIDRIKALQRLHQTGTITSNEQQPDEQDVTNALFDGSLSTNPRKTKRYTEDHMPYPTYWPSEYEIERIYKEDQRREALRDAQSARGESITPPDQKVDTPKGKRSNGATKSASAWLTTALYATRENESICKELANTSKNPFYRMYMTELGILDTFNFFGIVNNTGDGTKPLDTPTGNATLTNCVIQKQARTLNVWGPNLNTGTTCFLILKKLDAHGPYQLIPWASVNGDISPPTSELEYVCEDGVTKRLGHAIHVGTVQFHSGAQSPDEHTVTTACGITSKDRNFHPVRMEESLKCRPQLTYAWILIGN